MNKPFAFLRIGVIQYDGMKHIVQFSVYRGEKAFVGEGIDLPIVTQGKSIDEVAANLKEALALYLEGEDLSELGIVAEPSALVNFELEPLHA